MNYKKLFMTAAVVLSIAFTGTRTFDVVGLTSPDWAKWYLPMVGVLILDGGFLLWHFYVGYIAELNEQRIAGALMMCVSWFGMLGTCAADVLFRQQLTAQAMPEFAKDISLYSVIVVALLYVAAYAFVSWVDPATQRRVQEQQAMELIHRATITAAKSYAQRVAPVAGAKLGMAMLRDNYARSTGEQMPEIPETTPAAGASKILAMPLMISGNGNGNGHKELSGANPTPRQRGKR